MIPNYDKYVKTKDTKYRLKLLISLFENVTSQDHFFIFCFAAVKCNDDAFIVKELADLGTGFDCASKNEINLVSKWL